MIKCGDPNSHGFVMKAAVVHYAVLAVMIMLMYGRSLECGLTMAILLPG